MIKKCQTKIRFLISILIVVCAFGVVHAQDPNADGKTADRGFQPNGSYALSNIESISLVGGNLNYSIPLAALPASRGGRLKPSVYLLYNSKLYDTQVRMCLGASCTFKYTQTDLIKAFRGGWSYGTNYFVLTRNRAVNYVDGAPPPPYNTYKYKTEIFFPDGSSHQLRPAGQTHNDDYYPVAPGIGGTTTYYTTDGTYLRVQFSADGLSWTLYSSDGSTVNYNNSTGVQTTTDGNGNSYTVQNITLPNGNPATQIVDQLNRKITIEKPLSGPHFVRVNGVGGTELVTTINWTSTSPQGKKYLWKIFHDDDVYTYKTSIATHTVVSSINLPSGLSYQFQYNSQIFDPLNPTKSVGWGELYQATLPTGAKARYGYNMDNRHGNESDDIIEPPKILWNHPASKQLEYTERHDLVDTVKTDTWTYSINIAESGPAAGQTSSGVISGPDGSVTSEFFEINSSGNPNFGLDGLSYKSIQPDGSKIERVWLENMPSGGNGKKKNPYVKTEFTSITDGAGALAKTAVKDNVYDKNGNVIQQAEYDWVAYGDVPRDANGRPTGAIPASAQLKRVSVSNVYNQTPTADSAVFSQYTYKETTAPNLRNALAWSEVRSSLLATSALSRAEFYYDDPNGKGNLTSQRNWDSTKGALARPLSAGTYIAVSHVYDTNGNRTDSTDARGVRTQFVFGAINGFTNLYPTETRVAVDYPTLKRTTTQEYDFWTGVVTRVTDVDNNVSTATTFDVFGRPTLVKAAEGKTEETRTVTEYSDSLRRVIVRSDLDTLGVGKLVSIRHYDQLGRVCLSRQLEDSANQSETDETHGLKVQTRYRFTSTNSYTLTSNPYRAATSGAAGSEVTMGWTRAKVDRVGRIIETQTFGGTGLPDPWGTNTTSTGTVTTSYNANATTITDQAQPTGKSRKSITDGLGRLTEIYEDPLGENFQTTYAYSALNNLVTVTQGSQTRTFNYSSLSRLTSATNPESGTVSYQYDNNGNLSQKTDARGVVSTYVYDWLNRNTTIDYSNTASINPDVTRVYDTATNGKGKLAESYAGGTEGSSGNVEHTKIVSYDFLGRPLVQRQRFKSSGVWSADFQTQRAYNRASAVTSQTYPSGRTVSYGYDIAGRLQTFSGTLGDGVNRTYSSGIVYSPSGGLSKEQFGTNTAVYHKIHYNSSGQMCDVRASNVNDEWGGELGVLVNYYSTPYAHCGNGSNNNGNVLMSQTIINGVYFEDRYSYDSLNRLTAVSEYQNGTTLTGTQEYQYDRWGNRTIKPTSTLGTTKQFDVNTANNRLVVPGGQPGTMTYDSAGNLITDTYTGAGSREYDAENRMTRAWGGNNQWQDYTYNADGRRVRRKVDGTETRQVYGFDGELLAEYAANGAPSSPQKEYGYRNGQLLVTTMDTVWTDDAVPAGAAIAGDGESWNWVSSSPGPFSGSSAHQSNIVAGLHQHYFYGATATMSVNAGEKLVAYVYLDPANMPSEIMLQWAEGGSWEHRAYWGANNLPWGVDGTNSRRYMGPLPAAGSWVKLEVPASLVGLEGYTLHGMAFSMWGGRATWDRAGKTSGPNWLVSDQLGTPRMVIDQTGTLANVKRHDYLPFGEELFAPVGGRSAALGYAGGDGVRQQFTSYERDSETSLDFAQARYYSNLQGRFTGVDPLLASAQAAAPQTWNRYSYVGNNPLVFVDPSGMMTNHNFYSDNSDFMVDVRAPTYINGTTSVEPSASAVDAGFAAGLVGEAFSQGLEESSQQNSGTIVLIVGDPGLGDNSVGNNFDRVAETKRAELTDLGYSVVVVRASSDVDFANALTNNGRLQGVEYIGHGSSQVLFIGEQAGAHTNLQISELSMLSNANLAPDAYIKINACYAGMGNDSIAAGMATQLQRTTMAFDGGTIFSGAERRRVTVQTRRGEFPPARGPLYLIEDHGTRLVGFSP